MKKVVITGSTGFLGSHLVKKLRLNKTFDLHLFDRKKHSFFEKETLVDLLKNCDYCYHLAGVSSAKNTNLFKVNVFATINLLKILSKVSPNCQLFFASSFSVYKNPIWPRKINENSTLFPRNKYGLSKYLAEIVVILFSKLKKMKSTIFRISNVYGPGMKPNEHSVIATFLENIRKSKKICITGSGNQTRDFIYVDDVIDAFIDAQKKRKGYLKIVNICSGKSISINRLIFLLEGIIGKKAKTIYVSQGQRDNFWQGDNSCAYKLYSWKPKTNLKDGLMFTYKKLR